MSDTDARPDDEFPVDPGAAHDMPGSLEGPDIEQVPAGGAGADSGSASVVEVDPEDEGSIQDVSSQNEHPGVGTRGPERS